MAVQLSMNVHGGPYDGQEVLLRPDQIPDVMMIEGTSGEAWYRIRGNCLIYLDSEVRTESLSGMQKGRLAGPTL